MPRHRFSAVGCAAVAMPLLVAATASAAVTVRVEGKTKTLLAAKQVQVKSGWIRQGGVARGRCPATSPQGALDVATHHHWGGKFSARHGSYAISTILGETDSGGTIWKLFVNGVPATTGGCKLSLHPNAKLLFAAVSAHHPEYALALELPSHAGVNQSFTGKVLYYGANGHLHPLAGATISVAGHSGQTGANGTVPLSTSTPGTYVFHATDAGYVRAAAVTVRIS